MKNFDMPPVYNKESENWEKGVTELSNFFIANVDKHYFLDFLKERFQGAEMNPEMGKDEKMWREKWEERLGGLVGKAMGRIGHQIDTDRLLREALVEVTKRREDGELAPSNHLDNFCAEFPIDGFSADQLTA